jgi:hypothetical protein
MSGVSATAATKISFFIFLASFAATSSRDWFC